MDHFKRGNLIIKLAGANMDIDLTSGEDQISWVQAGCPWNQAEGVIDHHCAIKNIKICPYFCGVEYLDTVLCSYPNDNPLRQEYKILKSVTIQGSEYGWSRFCEPIIRALPQWFGIETANRRYLEDIDKMPTFLALADNGVIGFLTLHEHNAYAAEIHVMGVLPERHRQGVGTQLVTAAQDYLRQRRVEYLQVKTLSDAHPDENYARTRAFYIGLGFRPLEQFDTLWDAGNPCLQLIKSLY